MTAKKKTTEKTTKQDKPNTEEKDQDEIVIFGRPPTYKNPQELEARAVLYFERLKKKSEDISIPAHPTITGLVLFLGFCDRQSFYDYEKKKDFTHTIKVLRTMIANFYEENLTGANVTGIIFALKNLGWSDKTEIETTNRTVSMPSITKDGKEMAFDIGEKADGDEPSSNS